MSDLTDMERRLSALEHEVASIKRRLRPDAPGTWVDTISGSLRDYPEFDEVAALGKAARQNDRPPEATSDAA